jgi:hypothetical protein
VLSQQADRNNYLTLQTRIQCLLESTALLFVISFCYSFCFVSKRVFTFSTAFLWEERDEVQCRAEAPYTPTLSRYKYTCIVLLSSVTTDQGSLIDLTKTLGCASRMCHGCLLPNPSSSIRSQCRPVSEKMDLVVIRRGEKFCRSVSNCMDKTVLKPMAVRLMKFPPLFSCSKSHQWSLFWIRFEPQQPKNVLLCILFLF